MTNSDKGTSSGFVLKLVFGIVGIMMTVAVTAGGVLIGVGGYKESHNRVVRDVGTVRDGLKEEKDEREDADKIAAQRLDDEQKERRLADDVIKERLRLAERNQDTLIAIQEFNKSILTSIQADVEKIGDNYQSMTVRLAEVQKDVKGWEVEK